MNAIDITISGEAKSGRSSLAQLFKDFLATRGVRRVTVQDRDEYGGSDPTRPPGNPETRLAAIANTLDVTVRVVSATPGDLPLEHVNQLTVFLATYRLYDDNGLLAQVENKPVLAWDFRDAVAAIMSRSEEVWTPSQPTPEERGRSWVIREIEIDHVTDIGNLEDISERVMQQLAKVLPNWLSESEG